MGRSIKSLIDEEVYGDILLHDATFPEMDNVITKRFLKDYVGNLKDDILTLIDQNMLNIIRDSIDNDFYTRNEIINLINKHKLTDLEFKELLIKHINGIGIDFDNGFANDIEYSLEFSNSNAYFTEEEIDIKQYVIYYEGIDEFIYIDLLNAGFSSLYKDYCLKHDNLTSGDVMNIIKWFVGESDIDFTNESANNVDYEIDFDGGFGKYFIYDPIYSPFTNDGSFTENDYNFKKYVAFYDSNVNKFIYIDLLNAGFSSLYKDYCLKHDNLISSDVMNIIKWFVGESDIDFTNEFANDVDYEIDFDGGFGSFSENNYNFKKYVAFYDSNINKFIYIDLLNAGFSSLYKDYCLKHDNLTSGDVMNIIKWFIGESDIDFTNESANDIDYEIDFDGGFGSFSDENYNINDYIISYNPNINKFVCVDLLNAGFSSLYKNYLLKHNFTSSDIINIITWFINNHINDYIKKYLDTHINEYIKKYLDNNINKYFPENYNAQIGV